MRRSSLTLALQTQPKGGSASCEGQFQDPVPGAGALPPHHNTLTLLGIFILDTTAPHIRKYVTRVLLERAQRHAHQPAAA